MDWQPIDSAPKDGTEVLTFRDHFGKPHRHVARFVGGEWQRDGRFEAALWPPTHWMPLPSPPVSK